MAVIKKGCPKCAGDLFRSVDDFGSYWFCLQCGFETNDNEGVPGPSRELELESARLSGQAPWPPQGDIKIHYRGENWGKGKYSS